MELLLLDPIHSAGEDEDDGQNSKWFLIIWSEVWFLLQTESASEVCFLATSSFKIANVRLRHWLRNRLWNVDFEIADYVGNPHLQLKFCEFYAIFAVSAFFHQNSDLMEIINSYFLLEEVFIKLRDLAENIYLITNYIFMRTLSPWIWATILIFFQILCVLFQLCTF